MARSAHRVAMRTLGCKVNQVEAETIAAALVGAGVELVPEAEADVVIVTTCTVTGEADHKARKAVRHAHALPQAPVVVVTGCGAAVDDGTLVALGERVVVEADKAAVAGRVATLLGTRLQEPPRPAERTGAGFHIRPMVKVEDGCDNVCAYCIVPRARGVPRSTPLADVVAEVSALRDAGVREIVLTGINVGRYDDGGVRLPALIEAVGTTGIERIRLSSIEPEHVDEALLAAIAATPAFCEHLHVPLQSGADRTLAEMGRRYDASTYAAIVARARDAVPHLALATDVIVGFPGESDADAAETLAFLERVGFAKLHVFRYSARSGTPAAAREDRVAPETIAARAADVRALGDRMRLAHLRAQVGRALDVLVERAGEGVARDGSRVRFDPALAAPGDRTLLTATGVDEAGFVLGAW